MVEIRRLTVLERSIASGGGKIDEVFAACVRILIDFESGIGVSALSVLEEFMVVQIRAVCNAGVGSFAVPWPAIAEGTVDAFVEEFWGRSSRLSLAFKIFHEAV